MKAPWSDFCFSARSFFPELQWATGRSRVNKIRPTWCEPCAWGVGWEGGGGGRAEVDEEEHEGWGMTREREEDGVEVGEATATEDTGEDPIWPATRAAIPPANRQVLEITEDGGGVTHEEFGQRGPMGKFASLTSVLAVSWSPLAMRWFLISMRSSFSEKVIRDWATTFALCRRANETSVPMRRGLPDTRSVSSAAYRQKRTCSLRLSCSTGSFISYGGKKNIKNTWVFVGDEGLYFLVWSRSYCFLKSFHLSDPQIWE